MKLNLLVLKTHQIHKLKEQYELLGLEFTYHQHGKSPWHYSVESDGLVIEVYPLSENKTVDTNAIRLGFEVTNLEDIITQSENYGWKVKSSIKNTDFGQIATLQDIDGRKVDVKKANAL